VLLEIQLHTHPFSQISMIASLLLLTIPWVVLGAYSPSNHLWYQSPGSDFNTAIPLGNGRLGALLYGSASETILPNEHSVWSKQWQPRVNEKALQTYHDIRDKLVAGNLSDANAQILRDMSANPVSPASYSVTNSNHIDFGHDGSGITNYERWLDLQGGTAGVSYEYDGVAYRFVIDHKLSFTIMKSLSNLSDKGESWSQASHQVSSLCASRRRRLGSYTSISRYPVIMALLITRQPPKALHPKSL
jgi:hypothetical protein